MTSQNYREQNGEILPSYTGVNRPKYPHGSTRDTEIPHDAPTYDTPPEVYDELAAANARTAMQRADEYDFPADGSDTALTSAGDVAKWTDEQRANMKAGLRRVFRDNTR